MYYYQKIQWLLIVMGLSISFFIITIVEDIIKAITTIIPILTLIFAFYIKFVHDLKLRSFIGCTPECVLGEYMGSFVALSITGPMLMELNPESEDRILDEILEYMNKLKDLTAIYSKRYNLDFSKVLRDLEPEFYEDNMPDIFVPEEVISIFKGYLEILDLQGRLAKQMFLIRTITQPL